MGWMIYVLAQSIEFNEGMDNSKRIVFLRTALVKGREGNILRKKIKSLRPGMLEIRYPWIGKEAAGHDTKLGVVKTIIDCTFNALLTFQ